MYEGFIESLPFIQNVLAISFGQTYTIEAYLRRLEYLKCPNTKVIILTFINGVGSVFEIRSFVCELHNRIEGRGFQRTGLVEL